MRRFLFTALLALALSPFAFAQGGSGVTYTALAVNMNHPATGSAAHSVQIVVNHWTPDPARDRLINVLMDKGPDQLLEALKKQPRVGYIRTPDAIGYDLHYASRTPTGDGGMRVVLATDRPIGFWEASAQTRTLEYPFTVIEMRIKPNGEGEGKMSVATKITADAKDHLIVLENYSRQPVMLQAVHREKKSH